MCIIEKCFIVGTSWFGDFSQWSQTIPNGGKVKFHRRMHEKYTLINMHITYEYVYAQTKNNII